MLDMNASPDFESLETDRIRNAYHEWCLAYDKLPDLSRFEMFLTNFRLCQKYHDDTGMPLMLNEYADLSQEEYDALSSTGTIRILEPVSKIEDKIRTAYTQWCTFYGKPFDEERFTIFASNFLVVEKYHTETGHPLALNEFADLTEEEYMLGEGRVRNAYKDWCAYFDKTSDSNRYLRFARHFKIVEKHCKETGASLMLNKYADMTEDEYQLDTSKAQADDDIVENRIVQAYEEFTRYYGKTASETRLKIFAAHFLIVERYHESTGESIMLNQYADMTEDEYLRLKRNGGTTGSRILHKKFSPRANSKPRGSASTTDVLYKPPAMIGASQVSPINDEGSKPVQLKELGTLPDERPIKRDATTGVNDSEDSLSSSSRSDSVNYLESLAGSVSSFLNKCFSPFKPSYKSSWGGSSSHDSLYGPPPQTSNSPNNSPSNSPNNSPMEAVVALSPPPDFDSMARNRIRRAYVEWCNYYDNKEPSEERFDVFAAHYQIVQKFHDETGTPLVLNEYADFTEEEYNTVVTTAGAATTTLFGSVEGRIVDVYNDWCKWYGKTFEEERLKVFASNFLLLERYCQNNGSGEPLGLNEYADMTEEEYRRGESRIWQAYKEWCTYYGKEWDEQQHQRYPIFEMHFKTVERHVSETGAPLVLNEYADLLEEEYNAAFAAAAAKPKPKEEANDGGPPVVVVVEVEQRIVSAYKDWCRYYEKAPDNETRLKIFAAHFLIVERFHTSTGESLMLNQYADLTEEEFQEFSS